MIKANISSGIEKSLEVLEQGSDTIRLAACVQMVGGRKSNYIAVAVM